MIIALDFSCDTPIYLQIRNQFVIGISNGSLSPGDKLPTIRTLALETGVNTMTVNKAYQLLKQEGYIFTDRRNGAVVNSGFQSVKGLSKKTSDSLKIVISEAILNGLSENEFLSLCQRMYQNKE